MRYSIYFQLLIAFTIVVLFSSCFSVNNFQSAKTLDKGETEIGLGLALGSTFDVEGADVDTIDGIIRRGNPLGDLVLFGRHGVAKRFDFGMRISSVGDVGMDFKFMAIGSEHSDFAFSPGIGVSSNIYYLGLSRMFQLEVPLHFSFKLSDNFTFYLTPRYIGQTSSFVIFKNENWVDYGGGSLGFEIGKKVIFSVGLNYMKALHYSRYSVVNVGTGIRFRFGGKNNNERH